MVYARDALDGSVIPYPENFAAIETAIGVGNLVGGLAVGLIGARLRKGWLVVGGFIVMGASTVVLGLTGNVLVALAAATIIGIANLVYIIPTQTIFIEITPNELMGRVVAFRSSLVFGAMTLAMGGRGIACGERAGGPGHRRLRCADARGRSDRRAAAGVRDAALTPIIARRRCPTPPFRSSLPRCCLAWRSCAGLAGRAVSRRLRALGDELRAIDAAASSTRRPSWRREWVPNAQIWPS